MPHGQIDELQACFSTAAHTYYQSGRSDGWTFVLLALVVRTLAMSVRGNAMTFHKWTRGMTHHRWSASPYTWEAFAEARRTDWLGWLIVLAVLVLWQLT